MNAFPRRLMSSAAVALMSFGALSAGGLKFGLEMHGVMPLSDLKKDVGTKLGTGFQGFAMLDMYGGHAVRPRIGFTSLRNENFHERSVGAGHALKIDVLSAGVDYQYYLDRMTGEGWYMSFGGGFDRAKTTWNNPAGTLEETRVRPSLNAGVGIVALPNIGFEARYVIGRHSTFDPAGHSSESSTRRLEAGVVFIF